MPHFKHGKNTGYQSWENASYCFEGCDKDPESHVHCAGIEGKPVYYEKAEKPLGLDFGRSKDFPQSGHGIVVRHWHYDGCMIDLNDPETDGRPRIKLCPALGDKVWVLDSMPPELQDNFMGAL